LARRGKLRKELKRKYRERRWISGGGGNREGNERKDEIKG
jgi:hypothetical protein